MKMSERRTVEFELPAMNELPTGYVPREVSLDSESAVTLALLRDGLVAEQRTLKNGAAVQDTKNALRWLLEQVRDSVPVAG
jgi:hypothetical protein